MSNCNDPTAAGLEWRDKVRTLVIFPQDEVPPITDPDSAGAQELLADILQDVADATDPFLLQEYLALLDPLHGSLANNSFRKPQFEQLIIIQKALNAATTQLGGPQVLQNPLRSDYQGRALRCIDGVEQPVALNADFLADYNDVQISGDANTMVAAGSGVKRRYQPDGETDQYRECSESSSRLTDAREETLLGIQIYSRCKPKRGTCTQSDESPEWFLRQSMLTNVTINKLHVTIDGSGIVAYNVSANTVYILRNYGCASGDWVLTQTVQLEESNLDTTYAVCGAMHASANQSRIVVANKNLTTDERKIYVLTNDFSCVSGNGILSPSIDSAPHKLVQTIVSDQQFYYKEVTVSRDGQTLLVEYGTGEPVIAGEPAGSNIEDGFEGLRVYHWQSVSEEDCSCQYVLRQDIPYVDLPTGYRGNRYCVEDLSAFGCAASVQYTILFLNAGPLNVVTGVDTTGFTVQDISNAINAVSAGLTEVYNGQLCIVAANGDSIPSSIVEECNPAEDGHFASFEVVGQAYSDCTKGRTARIFFAGQDDNRIMRLVDRASHNEVSKEILDPRDTPWKLYTAESAVLQVFDREPLLTDICGKEVESCRDGIIDAWSTTLRRGDFAEFVAQPSVELSGCIAFAEPHNMLYTHRTNKHIFATWCSFFKDISVYCESEVDNEWIRVPASKHSYDWLATTAANESMSYRGYMAFTQDETCSTRTNICFPVVQRFSGRFVFRTISTTGAVSGPPGYFNGSDNAFIDLNNVNGSSYVLPGEHFIAAQVGVVDRPFLAAFPRSTPPTEADPAAEFTRSGVVSELPGSPAIPSPMPFPLLFRVWQRWPVDQPGFPVCRTGYFPLSEVDPFLRLGCNTVAEFVLTPRHYMFDASSTEPEPNPNSDPNWIISRSSAPAYITLSSICFDIVCPGKDCRCNRESYPFYYRSQLVELCAIV